MKLISKCIILAIFFCIFSSPSSAEVGAKSADKARQENPLLIGLIPEQNIFRQIERYEPLADYLSKKIGIKIKLKILTRYGNIIDNFKSFRLDGAFFGSFIYALASQKIGVKVLARPESRDGTSTYYGMIFSRKDSGIRTIHAMYGKRFAFVDKATTAGYLLPLAYFKKHGIQNFETYLKETYFTGTHEDAIYDVLNGRADIGAAKNTIFYRIAKTDNRLTSELAILARSPDVPENGLAVRKTLDNSVTKKMTDILLNMHKQPEGLEVLKNFGARKFIKTTDRDYEPVFKYAREINLNLATYDYMND